MSSKSNTRTPENEIHPVLVGYGCCCFDEGLNQAETLVQEKYFFRPLSIDRSTQEQYLLKYHSNLKANFFIELSKPLDILRCFVFHCVRFFTEVSHFKTFANGEHWTCRTSSRNKTTKRYLVSN